MLFSASPAGRVTPAHAEEPLVINQLTNPIKCITMVSPPMSGARLQCCDPRAS